MTPEQKAAFGRDVVMPSQLLVLVSVLSDLVEEYDGTEYPYPHVITISDYASAFGHRKQVFEEYLQRMGQEYVNVYRIIRMDATFNVHTPIAGSVNFCVPAINQRIANYLIELYHRLGKKFRTLYRPDSATSFNRKRLTAAGEDVQRHVTFEDPVVSSISGVMSTLQAACILAYAPEMPDIDVPTYKYGLGEILNTNMISQFTGAIELGTLVGITQSGVLPAQSNFSNNRLTEKFRAFLSGANSVFALSQPVSGRCPFLHTHRESTFVNMQQYYGEIDLKSFLESKVHNTNGIDLTARMLRNVI